jgi:TonB family protein
VFAGALATFAGYLIYSSGRLAWGLWRTDRLRRQARAVFLTGEAAAIWRRCYGMLAAGRGLREPEIFVSPMIHGPVTVGIWRPALLVQVGFLERVCDGDLEAVLAHEFAHVRRWDFAKNAMYGVLSLPVAWHPAVRLTRARMAESREMVCDAMAADAGAGRERFARSLLRVAALLAEGSSAGTVHVIGVGIFDANRFERRVMHLTQGRIEIRRSQRLILAVASGVVALATCAAALALRMDVAQPASGTTAVAAGRGAVIKVDGEVMAGLILYKKQPVYPAEAKANDDTVDGPVVLHVLVGKDGAVQEIRVAQSLRADYDQSALDAVREWRWQPYLLNDEPVAVDTNVTVTYSKAN